MNTDGLGFGRDAVDGPQRARADPVATGPGGKQQQRQREPEDVAEPFERTVEFLQWRGYLDCVGFAGYDDAPRSKADRRALYGEFLEDRFVG
jgi:hypothetical protein